MLFCSIEFIFYFLPLVLLGHYAFLFLRKYSALKIWLALSSLFFYGYWKPVYLPLIIASVLINFAFSRALLDPRAKRRLILLLGVSFNVGLLGFFKYFDFFISNFSLLLAIKDPFQLNLLLPLGISFFTFQQISYLVDCHKGLVTQHSGILDYFLFVTFFPQLIAGHIVHHSEMMPQFSPKSLSNLRLSNTVRGIFLFSAGLFKKIIIADTFAAWADQGFAHVSSLTFMDAWLASFSYTFQLYFDFSGYTDMALGLALFFGIVLPNNFNSPYKATNIQDFWHRLHMTLSRWLRDYIYIPLGGNRVSTRRNLLNLFLVFLIGGIWHGAGWTFVLWGGLHGLALIILRLWKLTKIKTPPLLGMAITFLFVNCTWVLFRADNLTSARLFFAKMVPMGDWGLTKPLTDLFFRLTGWVGFTFMTVPQKAPNLFQEPERILFFLLLTFILVFVWRNTTEQAATLPDSGMIRTLGFSMFSAFLFITALAFMYLVPAATFLYFNF